MTSERLEGLEVSVISGHVGKDMCGLDFCYCLCAAAFMVATQSGLFCECAKNIHVIIWMHRDSFAGIICPRTSFM